MPNAAPAACYASPQMDWKNKLYFGDNLGILREHVADARIDLIRLDPPVSAERAVRRKSLTKWA
jgi:hypothetical protein